MGPVLEFLLVPDASAVRRLRRALARQQAWTGVRVGTWPSLIAQALRTYAIAEPHREPEGLAKSLSAADDAFWTETFATHPEATVAAVARALTDLLQASDPASGAEGVADQVTSRRLRKRLQDLKDLVTRHPSAVPAQLRSIQLLLACSQTPPVPLRVRAVPGVPYLSKWQLALVDRLNADADGTAHPQGELLDRVQRSCLVPDARAPSGSALRSMQEHLFGSEPSRVGMDRTVQWIGLREHYQEAEIAAGMAQSMLADEPGLRARDIGLLVPDSFEYSVAIADCFGLAGLSLAGLRGERWKRDLGRELVYQFLHCRQEPACAMALAVCFSSRLMPWPRKVGGQLARAVMDGQFAPTLPPEVTTEESVRMRSLLLAGDDTPDSLRTALVEFARLLDGGERFGAHVTRAVEGAQAVIQGLRGATSIDWTELRKLVRPEMVTNGQGPEFNLEGVTVWSEAHEPWRAVKHLIVFAFCEGHYPAHTSASSVFSQPELNELRERAGLSVDRQADRVARARLLLRRQLRSVSGSVSFLVPHFGPGGEAVGASESFIFMERLVRSPFAGGLVAMLDSTEGLARIRHLATVRPSTPTGPREFRHRGPVLNLGRDLLTMRLGRDGKPAPQSPTSLETLLVSPLGWLLRSLKAEPIEWRPESISPRVTGGLAHAVFERLFKPDQNLIPPDTAGQSAKQELATVARQQAPFLARPHWFVERRSMAASTAKAAEAWRSVLEGLQAEILGIEEWLEGNWSGVRIHGKADLILGLEHSTILIVDYKWSNSKKRWEQMEKGYESQITLYREMVRTGGIKVSRNRRGKVRPELARKLRLARRIETAYFTMLDQSCLSVYSTPSTAAIHNWRAVEGNPSENALESIQDRLLQVQFGQIELNRSSDREDCWRRFALPTFALDISPLIELFPLGEEPEGIAEGE